MPGLFDDILSGNGADGPAPTAGVPAPGKGGLFDDIIGPQPPEMTTGHAAGLTGRAVVQAAPGAVAGLPAMAYDAVVNLPRYLTKEAYNAAARQFGWQETPLNDPMATTHALSQAGEMTADAVGLPQPATPGERIAITGGQTALEALSGAGLAKAGSKVAARTVEALPTLSRRAPEAAQQVLAELGQAPVTQGVVGGLAGGGAQTAQENGYNPLMGMGLGLAGGIAGAGVVHALPEAARAGRGVVDRALLRTEEAQRAAANERVRSAATNPTTAMRKLDEGASGELVPGSKPTAFQATGDAGLGSLERQMQTQYPAVDNQGRPTFAQRREDQNSARLNSLQSIQGEGNPHEVVSFLKDQLNQIDQMTAGQEASARSAAEAAAEKIQPTDTAQGVGGSIRGSMVDAEKAARAREDALWKAVDPEGSLTVATQWAKQKVAELYGNMTTAAKIGLASVEKEFVAAVQGYKPIESFNEFRDLGSQIKEAMRTELMKNGRTQTYGPPRSIEPGGTQWY